MRIGSTGILVNEMGQVLLIRRNDTRSFAPPGGGLDIGELPTDGAAREVREETGIITLPVRLVGLHYRRAHQIGFLAFYFRCLQRGGELQTSIESPQVGFFSTNPLPRPMWYVHRHGIQQSLTHTGGRPFWHWHHFGFTSRLGYALLHLVGYPLFNWVRSRQGYPSHQPPPIWEAAVFIVVTNSEGQVLWRRNGNRWQLPGGPGLENTPPWESAIRHMQNQLKQAINLINLTGVYPAKDKPHMIFVFTASLGNGRLPTTDNFAYFHPGQEPNTCVPSHKAQVADALSSGAETLFRFQEQPL